MRCLIQAVPFAPLSPLLPLCPMNRLTSIIAMTLCMVPSVIGQQGQIYLIAGTPMRNNPSAFQIALVSVAPDGSTQVEKELVSPEVGAEWITTDYDARKAVILTKDPDNQVVILDYDTASVTKSCANPDGNMLADRWLADSPEHGPMFVGYGKNPVSRQIELLGMVDPSTPCKESFIKMRADDLTYFVGDGVADLRTTNRLTRSTPSSALKGALATSGWTTAKHIFPITFRLSGSLI